MKHLYFKVQLLYYIIVVLQLFLWFSKCIFNSSQMLRLFMGFCSLELFSQASSSTSAQATSSTSTSTQATSGSIFCTSTLPQFCFDVKLFTRSFLKLYRRAFVKKRTLLANLIPQNPSKVHSAEAYSAIQEYDFDQHFRWGSIYIWLSPAAQLKMNQYI